MTEFVFAQLASSVGGSPWLVLAYGLVVDNGTTFTHTFDTAGTFAYHCALHTVSGGTGMNGTISVNAPPDGPPTYR